MFRQHERESVAELVARDKPHVIAPGGGWAAEPGSLAAVADHALTIYLETPPAVAADRIKGTGDRPLLDSGSSGRETRMRELFRRRRRSYAACDAVVNTADRTAVEVARKVAELALSQLG